MLERGTKNCAEYELTVCVLEIDYNRLNRSSGVSCNVTVHQDRVGYHGYVTYISVSD